MRDVQQLVPNLIAASEGGSPWGVFSFVVFVIAIIFGLVFYAKGSFGKRGANNLIANMLEHLFLFIRNMAVAIIGPHGIKYVHILCALWLFIFVSNIVGLFFDVTPTADWSLNFGLAIAAVMYVQYEGIRANGFFGHLRHFAGPKIGGMPVVPALAISALIFMIEFVSEWMKMVSLSLRLYGNIHGGHEVVANLNSLGKFSVGDFDVAIPIGALLLPIKLLTCLVQALVFTLLLAVYLGLVTHHDDEHHEATAKAA